ncbi:hypothetical protein ABK040_016320 [Willaertia magna]
MGILKVTVVCANNLLAKYRGGLFSKASSDPYVIVRIGMVHQKTSVKHENLNPSFNESFTFTNITDPNKDILSFEIYDSDRTKDDLIGVVSLPLSTLPKGKSQRFILNLTSTTKHTNAGTIVVECLAEDFGIVTQQPQQQGQPPLQQHSQTTPTMDQQHFQQQSLMDQQQQHYQQQPMMQQQYPMPQQQQYIYPPTMYQQPYYQQLPTIMPQGLSHQYQQQVPPNMGFIQQPYFPPQQYPPYFQQFPPPA